VHISKFEAAGRAGWASEGACKDVDPESLFVAGAAQHRAKLICAGCVVRIECLADALDNRIEFGVWGGMTERERRALLRRRPEVRSWWAFLGSRKNSDEYARPPRPYARRSRPVSSAVGE
jgi:WhiB family redox-sensing transcriptional regulator